MVYQAILSDTRQITISNQGQQTQITLVSSSSGQQQSQSNGLTTGTWNNPPQLFNTAEGLILQIDGEHDQYFIRIQANGISTAKSISPLPNATPVKLREIADSPSQPFLNFEPMQPMQPMKMGNMSMDINSMSMQMGNMSLNLGNQSKTTVSQVFCSQCGTEAKKGDRFCRSCGGDLNK